MDTFFWIAVIGSGLIAVWSFLFGASSNILFGVAFDGVRSLDVSPTIGENLMNLIEVVTVVAVAIFVGRCAGFYIDSSCVEPLWRLIACFFLGLAGALIYVVALWEGMYLIFYWLCCALIILIGFIDDVLGWLFEKF